MGFVKGEGKTPDMSCISLVLAISTKVVESTYTIIL